MGGPAQELERANSKKRTVYGRASRSPSSLLTLFDYPDPNITSDQREVTNVPLQGLFFMNSDLIQREADALLSRLGPEEDPAGRIERAYRLLFQRRPSQAEVQRGLEFLKKAEALFQSAPAETASPQASQPTQEAQRRPRARAAAVTSGEESQAAAIPALPAGRMTPWQQYAQALLSAGEFYYVN